MSDVTVDVVDDAARACAERLAAQARAGGSIVLTGGSTPKHAYEIAAELEPDWSRVDVWWGDERQVPPDDERSNYRMARTTFLDAVAIPAANVHRMRGEADPAAAAREYADLLSAELGNSPCLDLVLLGLGPDGHTASLFPGSSPETDSDALVRAVYAESQAMWRITITPKVINAARTVAFAVEGEEKATILAAILEGPYDPVVHPAQIVAPSPGRLLWLADRAASSVVSS